MAIRISRLVWDRAPYKGNRLLTLLSLADHADETGNCYPSIRLLALETRQSERNVRYQISSIEQDKIIKVARSKGGRHKSNRYHIYEETLQTFPGFWAIETGSPAPKPCKTRHTNPAKAIAAESPIESVLVTRKEERVPEEKTFNARHAGGKAIDRVLSCLPSARKGNAQWTARCPAHDDRNPSLAIRDGQGKALVYCHGGCRTEDVIKALGLSMSDLYDQTEAQSGRKIVALYDYTDREGRLLFQVIRYDPKSFSQRRPNSNGRWIYNLNGVPKVLYRLPEVLSASHVLVVEGEKDAETGHGLGLVTTCNSSGSAGKWRPEYSEFLQDKHVTVIPDADEPGRMHAYEIVGSLLGFAASVKFVELPDAKDLTEWVEKGGTRKQLDQLIAKTVEEDVPY